MLNTYKLSYLAHQLAGPLRSELFINNSCKFYVTAYQRSAGVLLQSLFRQHYKILQKLKHLVLRYLD